MYSIKEGEYLVRLARNTLESYLKKGRLPKVKKSPEKLRELAGVFVTLETYPERELRGCIGFPEPLFPLIEALMKAAISAAIRDPRFKPVALEELRNIVVEVSVLSRPELIKTSPKKYPKEIILGRHGLIVERGLYRGLLLPQVAVDEEWSEEEFLSHTCMKAGLMPDAWLLKGTKIYRFEGIVFSEVSPGGRVVERKLR